MSYMKTYLFDFDGTLVDSMPTFISVMLKVLDENGISYAEDIVKVITPLGYKGTAEYYQSLGVSLSVSEIMNRMTAYAEIEYRERILAKSHVIETLRVLKERGDSLNILTASPHNMLDPCLKRLGIYSLFNHIWSCDDFRKTKADVEIYQEAASCIGAKTQDVVFLDDNVNALKTAKKSGMVVYGVYDASSEDSRTQIEELSDRYIIDFSELI